MISARWRAPGVAAALILFQAWGAGAQTPTPQTPTQPTPVPSTPTVPTVPAPTGPSQTPPSKDDEAAPPEEEAVMEPRRAPEDLAPTYTPTFVGPDLFNPPAHQGWLTITPSLTLSGEYNDNIFFSSEDRRDDWILGLTPGFTLTMQRPEYRLVAGYNTRGEIFLNEDDLSGFGNRHEAFADFSYRLSPRLRFTLTDRFIFTEDSNALTSSGASTGRREGWRNTLSPRLRFQATPTTAVDLFASYTTIRFNDDSDSDTYRLGFGVDRELTPRLSVGGGLGVAYIEFEGSPETWTYTPNVGLTYQITPTLRGSVSAGPTVFVQDDETEITPSVAVELTQTFKWATAAIGYNRAVTAETIGVSDRQIIFGSLSIPALVRGLQIGFLPRYAMVDRDIGNDDSQVDALTLTLRATYQIARSISLIGSYTFFDQRTERGRGIDDDIEQNRVFLGIQYAFPITIY